MLFFRNDYGNGAHPAVMEALCKTNLELTAGYGTDAYCENAVRRIRQLCDNPQADVHKAFRPNQRLHSFDDITVEVWI